MRETGSRGHLLRTKTDSVIESMNLKHEVLQQRVRSVFVREQATQKLVRRWGALGANRECEETENEDLGEKLPSFMGESLSRSE